MAAFKSHCAFGFWRAALMKEAAELIVAQNASMEHLARIKSIKDNPPAARMRTLIKEAVQLNENSVKIPARAALPN